MEAEALPDGLAHRIAELESEKFGDMKVETLVVTNAIADTLTCVEAEAPVKTEGDTVLAVHAYTDFDMLKEDGAKALAYTQDHTFRQVQASSVTDTLILF